MPVTLSASQLKTFRLCPRKWYYQKILRLPQKPQGKGAALGEKMHAQIEHFLTTAEDVRSPLAKLSDRFLEPYSALYPYTGNGRGFIELELWPALPTPHDADLTGYIDAVFVTSHKTADIIDHKFRADVEQYAETEAELRDDEQAQIYGFWVWQNLLGGAPDALVTFAHHNHQTKGRAYASRVEVSFDAPQLKAGFASICDTVGELVSTSKLELDAVPGPSSSAACAAFGGCDFAALCPLSPVNKFRNSILKGPNMAIADVIAKYSQETLPPPENAPEVEPPKTLASFKVGDFVSMNGSSYRIDNFADGWAFLTRDDGKTGRKPADTKCAAGEPFGQVETTAENAEPEAVSVLPPDAPPTDSVKPVEVTPAEAPNVVIEDPIPQPKRRGRPAKSVKVANGVIGTDSTQIRTDSAPIRGELPTIKSELPTIKSELPTIQSEPPTIDEETDTALVLCINAVCSVGSDLNGFVANVAAELAKKCNVPDIRLAPKDSQLGYGGWKAVLSAEVNATIKGGIWNAISSELVDACLDQLSARALSITRGVSR